MQRQYLSIDIGGTAIKYAQIDHSGNLFAKKHISTPHQKQDFITALHTIILAIKNRVSAVCISVPGIVDPFTGKVSFTGALSFMGTYDMKKDIQQLTGLPVFIGNDANCATLAEMWLGNLKDVANGAVITLGTSVGGGIVINSQLIQGPHFQAGELSAMIINHDAEKLHYSTVGATTSAVKMIEKIANYYGLSDRTNGRTVFAKIKEHDKVAWSIFEGFCRRVAVLILNMQTIMDLERVLIGGGISAQKILISEIRRQFKLLQYGDRRLHDDVTMPVITKAKFGNEANLLGALYGLLLEHEQQK